jgi:hypothetical protein
MARVAALGVRFPTLATPLVAAAQPASAFWEETVSMLSGWFMVAPSSPTNEVCKIKKKQNV